MSDLLRVYWNSDEIGADGYPYAWHKPGWERLLDAGRDLAPELTDDKVASLKEWLREPGAQPAIKDFIRDRDGHRCLRCGHPYRKGQHAMEEYEDDEGKFYVSWSPCDATCTHYGPVRMQDTEDEDETWREYDLSVIGQPAGDAIFEVGPDQALRRRWVVEASWRILTVHHLNGVKHDCRWWNLVSLCQRCHLTIQAKVWMERPYERPHSEWFQPFVAGFYAWKYLDLELTREQAMERLDELLALELRQDALF
jgi:5-methylcytosine-specific restriction endonuclease McrA